MKFASNLSPIPTYRTPVLIILFNADPNIASAPAREVLC